MMHDALSCLGTELLAGIIGQSGRELAAGYRLL